MYHLVIPGANDLDVSQIVDAPSRAKQQLGLGSVDEALPGLVVVVQRTDGALRLNVHLHVLGLDGVYVEDEGELRFHTLGTPSSATCWCGFAQFELYESRIAGLTVTGRATVELLGMNSDDRVQLRGILYGRGWRPE